MFVSNFKKVFWGYNPGPLQVNFPVQTGTHLYEWVEVYKAGSTLAANSRGIKRFLTPSLAAC
jgi:hypothetical protein